MTNFYYKTAFDALIGMKFHKIRVVKPKNRQPYSIHTLGNYCTGLMNTQEKFDIMPEDKHILTPKSGDLVNYWSVFNGYIYKIVDGVAYISSVCDDVDDDIIERHADQVRVDEIHQIFRRGDNPFPEFFKE